MSTNLILPANGSIVDICAEFQQEFESCCKFKDEKKLILSLADNYKNLWDYTTPSAVNFEWETDEQLSQFELSDNPDFINTEIYTSQNKAISVFNLKKDTEYFWRVNNSDYFSFRTDSVMPRWIKAEGIGNVRDLGGRLNSDGVKIKQGLIYRGPKFENDITHKGIERLRKLGIKTDLDLREEADDKNTSVLGKDIKYILNPCKGYDEFIENDIKSGNCKNIIELFEDEDNYPIYFHCAGGQDRTGTIAFLIDAILGLDDYNLIREYELTMLSSPDQGISRSRKKKFKPFLKYLNKNGKRKSMLSDKTIKLLNDAGVKKETLDKIRGIMLEKN